MQELEILIDVISYQRFKNLFEVNMAEKKSIDKIKSELQKGINLAKCRKCGCMKETLELLSNSPQIAGYANLFKCVENWLSEMQDIEYQCLGCKYCYPAIAMNIFYETFPETILRLPDHIVNVQNQTWPPIPGEYFAFCEGQNCPVAVSTLSNAELAEKIARIKPYGLCIVGKTETENIGMEKVIKNIITNTTIRFLLLVGKDSAGHFSGETFIALWKNGVDENMKIIGSPGKHPVLRNVTKHEVESFRKQIKIVNMIGCEDENKIVGEIEKLSREVKTCACKFGSWKINREEISAVEVIQAEEPEKIEMDKAGYFVIIPQLHRNIIVVEHYSYNNELLHVIEGKDARSIYWTIIKNGWVTQLSHSAYLGKELARAELSLKLGFKYIQDKA